MFDHASASPAPEMLLTAAVDALLAEDAAVLDPLAALERARVLQVQAERLQAASLTSVRDLDDRELFALDGAGSARGWLRNQVSGDHGQVALARRLRTRAQVRGALEAGQVNTRGAGAICTALVGLDDIEAGTGALLCDLCPIPEAQIIGVLLHAVPDVLAAWTGWARPVIGAGPVDLTELPDLPPALDPQLQTVREVRRAQLASVLVTAAEGVGASAADRLEPVFVLLARALSPHALADALSTILDALLPERIGSRTGTWTASCTSHCASGGPAAGT